MPKTSYTNADLVERKPMSITVEKLASSRPYVPNRDAQLLDEAFARGDTADSLLSSSKQALRRTAPLANEMLAARAHDVTAAEVAALDQSRKLPVLMDTVGALTGVGSAVEAIEEGSPMKMALAALAAYPMIKSAGMASKAFSGLRGGGKAVKAVTMPTGQQRAIEANKGYEVLKQERLGGKKPSPQYDVQLKQHAAAAEGIPSAYMQGPRSQTRISHLSQLPEEREITAEQLWKHTDPEILDRLAKMFGL